MTIATIIDYFIHPAYHQQPKELRKARMLVRASLLTSLFSNSYIWLSMYFGYDKGVYMMTFNVIGFLLLPLLVKTRLPLQLITNLFVLIGATAIATLTYFSGGITSAVYPWLICIPVLATLVANQASGIFWTIVVFLTMVWFGYEAVQGREFPKEYNTDMYTMWYASVVPGLLLIIMLVILVFETLQSKALLTLEAKNQQLVEQKETIAEQSRKLEALIKEKDNIIQIIAHDLKSPLSNVISLTELLVVEADRAQQEMYTALIGQAANNAHTLVRRVLEMDSLEQGGRAVQLEPIELQPVLTRLVAEMRTHAASKQIDIKVEQIDGAVLADYTYLHQILENLLSNAIKFSPTGKTVILCAEKKEDGKIHLKIVDQGPGIPPEEEHKLFTKYAQLSTKPTNGEGSTGLGLSLVKHYVKKLNGSVAYQPNPDGGAVFVVELPVGQMAGSV